MKRVICIVDAEQIEDQLKDRPEAIQQIAFSDIILLNKVEKVSADDITELQGILKTINPFASTLVASGQDFKIKSMFARERFANFYSNPKPVVTPRGIFSLGTGTLEKQPLVASSSSHNRHEHSDIETILLKYKESMNVSELEHRMMVFLILQSASVYRVKGIIYSHLFESRLVLQTVGKSLAITLGDVWLPDEVRETKIVIIGKQLKVYGFDKMFRTCLYPEPVG